MWVIVLFDLPTKTKQQKKEYGGFRKKPFGIWFLSNAILSLRQICTQFRKG